MTASIAGIWRVSGASCGFGKLMGQPECFMCRYPARLSGNDRSIVHMVKLVVYSSFRWDMSISGHGPGKFNVQGAALRQQLGSLMEPSEKTNQPISFR